MESAKERQTNFVDVLSVPQLWTHLRGAELTAVRGCSHAARTHHDATVTSAHIVLRDRAPGEAATRMLEGLRRISGRGCRLAQLAVTRLQSEGCGRLWSDVLSLPMCSCATRLALLGPHALPSQELAAALPALAPCVRQLTVQLYDTSTSGAVDVLLAALGPRLEVLELQLCGGAVVPCEGLLALAAAAAAAAAARGATASCAANGAASGAATAADPAPQSAKAAACQSPGSPCWIVGGQQRTRDGCEGTAVKQTCGTAVAAAPGAAVAAAAGMAAAPGAPAAAGGHRRHAGGRGLRELRLVLALDRHMHIGTFRYGTQARPGGPGGQGGGGGGGGSSGGGPSAWRRSSGTTAAAQSPPARAAAGRAVPPAVAAIAALAPALRALSLTGPCVARVLDPPGRLLGLSALTNLERLQVELPAAADPYVTSGGGGGGGYGGGRYGGGSGAAGWDAGDGGGGGAACDGGGGGWKLGPLLAAMTWIRDLDLGPSYRLPPEALVSLAALTQLTRLRCGSIATPPPQQHQSLAAVAAAAAAAGSPPEFMDAAAEAVSAAHRDAFRRPGSSGPSASAGAGSSLPSGGMEGVWERQEGPTGADELQTTVQMHTQTQPTTCADGCQAATAPLLPLPAGVLRLPLPPALTVLEVSALPAVPVLAALAALPRLRALRITPAAPAPAPGPALGPAQPGAAAVGVAASRSALLGAAASARQAVGAGRPPAAVTAAHTRPMAGGSAQADTRDSAGGGSGSLPGAAAPREGTSGGGVGGSSRVWVPARKAQGAGGTEAAALPQQAAPASSGATAATIPAPSAATASGSSMAKADATASEPLRLALVGDEWEHGQHHPAGLQLQLQREQVGRRLGAAAAVAAAAEQGGPPGTGGAAGSQPQEVVTAARLLQRVLPPSARCRLSLHPFTRSPARLAGPHAAWMSELWPLAGDSGGGGGGNGGGSTGGGCTGGSSGGVEAVEVAGLDLAAGDLEALLAALPRVKSLGLFMCRLPDADLARRLQAERPGLTLRVDSSCVYDNPPAASLYGGGGHVPYGRGGYGRGANGQYGGALGDGDDEEEFVDEAEIREEDPDKEVAALGGALWPIAVELQRAYERALDATDDDEEGEGEEADGGGEAGDSEVAEWEEDGGAAWDEQS